MKKHLILGAALALLGVAGFAKAADVETASGGNVHASFVITVNPNGSISLSSTGFGPYDGADDTAIDVVNNSTGSLPSVNISSTEDILGFDGDGIVTFVAGATGVSGYEGPDNSFTNEVGETFINGGADGVGQTATTESATVVFGPALAPGASTYFSLEEDLTGANGGITVTAGTPLPSAAIMGLVGIAGLGLMKKLAPKLA